MRVRGLIAVCAVLVLCGTPLASARTQAFGDPVGPIEATELGGAHVVTFTPDAGVTCSPDSGSQFGIGTTVVSCSFDADGSSAGSFNVTVVDTTGPVLSGMPADQSVSTDSPPEPVSWSGPSANDLVDGPVGTSCSPSSGQSFNAGVTTTHRQRRSPSQ